MSFIGHRKNNFIGNDSYRGEPVRYTLHELRTVGYARTNIIGSRTSVVITLIRSSLRGKGCVLGVIRSRSSAYSKVTV
jgi:hypothetical protein